MLTRDDLIDLIIETVGRHLKPAPAPAAAPVAPTPPLTAAPSPAAAKSGKPNKEKPAQRGRLFLSEYDIRQRLTPGGRRLTIPRDAIISPLASDWLVLQGIEIVRE